MSSASPVPPIDTTAPLAVRWRPRTFDDVVGQRAPVAVLRAGAASDSPPRQLLLAGGSGLGKTTLGRIYAAALCCEDPPSPGAACGVCRSCVDVLTPGRSHPDVVEVDAASAGGKDEIVRLAASARTAPMRAPWRIWIIDEAHGVSKAGVDAFLKLLEEPPPQVCFVLATTEVDRMPATLRGRCLELRLAPPSREDLAANLKRVADGEGWPLEDDIVSLVLDATDPELGVRGTLTTLGRLEPLISSATLDTDLAASVLGVATAHGATEVLEAVAAGNHTELFSALDGFVNHFGEPAARRRLLDTAVERLRAAAAGNEATFEPSRTVELLADAAPSRLGLTVALVRAATPPSPQDPDAAVLAAQQLETAVDEATKLLEQLAAVTASASAVIDAPPPRPPDSTLTNDSAAPEADPVDVAAGPANRTGGQGPASEGFFPDGSPIPTEPPPEASYEGDYSESYGTPPYAPGPEPARQPKSGPSKKAPVKKAASKKAPVKKSAPRKRTGAPRAGRQMSNPSVDAWFSDPASSTTQPASPVEPATNQPRNAPSSRESAPSAPVATGGLSARRATADAAASKVVAKLRSRSRKAAALLAACDIADLGKGKLRIVVPYERTDDARRGQFREFVETAAASAGFTEVLWRRTAGPQ